MRQLRFAVLVPFALAILPIASAAQRAAGPSVAPSVAAPAVRVAPAYAAPHAAFVGAPRGLSSHATPRIGTRSVRSSAPSSSAKPPARASASAGPPKISWNSVSPSSSSTGSSSNGSTATDNNGVRVVVHTNGPFLPTYPPQVPNAPVLLPGDIFSGQSCYAPVLCNATPGLGFDYDHFFKVHPNWGGQILTAGVVVPFGGQGGLYTPVPYYFPGYYPTGPAQEEEQGAPPNENAGNYPPPNGTGNYNPNGQMSQQQPSAPPAAQNYYAPSEPVYEYVFVKRDGTRIFAVAYSLTKEKLSYVTKDGVRRTLPLEALDFDATRKSNEERGNTVTLPSAPAAAMAMSS